MDRSSFLKSLFVVVASPKVLAEVKTQPKAVISAGFYNDLQFVILDYIPNLCEKYGPQRFGQIMDEIGNGEYAVKHFYHFEKQANG